jgi:hypothetical protein
MMLNGVVYDMSTGLPDATWGTVPAVAA